MKKAIRMMEASSPSSSPSAASTFNASIATIDGVDEAVRSSSSSESTEHGNTPLHQGIPSTATDDRSATVSGTTGANGSEFTSQDEYNDTIEINENKDSASDDGNMEDVLIGSSSSATTPPASSPAGMELSSSARTAATSASIVSPTSSPLPSPPPSGSSFAASIMTTTTDEDGENDEMDEDDHHEILEDELLLRHVDDRKRRRQQQQQQQLAWKQRRSTSPIENDDDDDMEDEVEASPLLPAAATAGDEEKDKFDAIDEKQQQRQEVEIDRNESPSAPTAISSQRERQIHNSLQFKHNDSSDDSENDNVVTLNASQAAIAATQEIDRKPSSSIVDNPDEEEHDLDGDDEEISATSPLIATTITTARSTYTGNTERREIPPIIPKLDKNKEIEEEKEEIKAISDDNITLKPPPPTIGQLQFQPLRRRTRSTPTPGRGSRNKNRLPLLSSPTRRLQYQKHETNEEEMGLIPANTIASMTEEGRETFENEHNSNKIDHEYDEFGDFDDFTATPVLDSGRYTASTMETSSEVENESINTTQSSSPSIATSSGSTTSSSTRRRIVGGRSSGRRQRTNTDDTGDDCYDYSIYDSSRSIGFASAPTILQRSSYPSASTITTASTSSRQQQQQSLSSFAERHSPPRGVALRGYPATSSERQTGAAAAGTAHANNDNSNTSGRILLSSLDSGMAALRRWVRSRFATPASAGVSHVSNIAASTTRGVTTRRVGRTRRPRPSRAATLQLGEEDLLTLTGDGGYGDLSDYSSNIDYYYDPRRVSGVGSSRRSNSDDDGEENSSQRRHYYYREGDDQNHDEYFYGPSSINNRAHHLHYHHHPHNYHHYHQQRPMMYPPPIEEEEETPQPTASSSPSPSTRRQRAFSEPDRTTIRNFFLYRGFQPLRRRRRRQQLLENSTATASSGSSSTTQQQEGRRRGGGSQSSSSSTRRGRGRRRSRNQNSDSLNTSESIHSLSSGVISQRGSFGGGGVPATSPSSISSAYSDTDVVGLSNSTSGINTMGIPLRSQHDSNNTSLPPDATGAVSTEDGTSNAASSARVRMTSETAPGSRNNIPSETFINEPSETSDDNNNTDTNNGIIIRSPLTASPVPPPTSGNNNTASSTNNTAMENDDTTNNNNENNNLDPNREARARWIRINRRFQLIITIVALIFSLLLFAILVCWVVLTSAYVISIDKYCDVPLKTYFWLATLQLILDVFRNDIMRLVLRWDRNSRQRVPPRVVLYYIAYLIYAMLVLRMGIRSVFLNNGAACPKSAPELFQASTIFVSLSVAAWSTIILGYLVPFCFVAIILTRNGYSPTADLDGRMHGPAAGVGVVPGVFPGYMNSGAPPECIDQLRVVLLEEFPEHYPKDCCICMGDFVAGEVIVATECEHVFHKRCFQEWLRQARTCPVCRTDIPDSLAAANDNTGDRGNTNNEAVQQNNEATEQQPARLFNQNEFHQEVANLLQILRQHEQRLRGRNASIAERDNEENPTTGTELPRNNSPAPLNAAEQSIPYNTQNMISAEEGRIVNQSINSVE